MNRNERGFTQLELLVAATLMTIIGGGVTLLLSSGMDSYRTGVTHAEIERMASRTLDRVVEELSMSGAEVLAPARRAPLSASALTLQRNEGWDGTAIRWGAPISLRLEPDVDDPDDGIDNNGNGLVDECALVLRLDIGEPTERKVVLTRWVREYLEGEEPNGKDDNGNGLEDERGFSLDVADGIWNVRLTIERYDSKGRLVTRTLETSIRPRN